MGEGNNHLRLQITDSHGRTTQARLRPGSHLIGRSPECIICFSERARGVSKRHARIQFNGNRVILEDLESKTGTMVNGRVIRIAPLEDGDVISIGRVTMRVIRPTPTETPTKSEIILPGPEEAEIAETAEEMAAQLSELREATDRLFAEMENRIIGQKHILRMIWAAILARGHCLLVGVPGLAKTLMVTTFAEALGLDSKRIQFTPDLMPADILGSNVLHETESGGRVFEFIQGPIFTQLLLADEINRTPPKTQAALLEAMQERQVTIADRSLSLPEPFCVIASQNPIEQEGTYPLPEAQQDRFMLCLRLTYPTEPEEVKILLETTQGTTPDIAEALCFKDILRFQETVNGIVVSREAAAYAARIVRATRCDTPESPLWLRHLVDWGAGPRAGQAMLRAAKALAAMEGRPAVSIQDVSELAPDVLRHRIRCNFRARSEELDEESIIQRILQEVKSI